MTGVYAFMVVLTVVRRLAGGVVMSDNDMFVPYLATLVAALGYECFTVIAFQAALRRGRLISGWRLTGGAVLEVAAPAAILTIAHVWSPRGAYAAFSAPPLLLFPLTVLLSVLRLRPRTTLWLGVGAGVFHGLLALDTIRAEHLDASKYPVLLSYGVLLALTGVAGALVSRAARRYVVEAVAEAEARERAGLKLAAVERDLEVAREIQLGLLPVGSPGFAGFDIAGMNTPADKTGGDYYDWQRLPNGRLLVVMADVTGHGIGPALVMAVCRAYARASAPLEMDPTTLMGRLNGLLVSDIRGGRFITLAMAVLETGGGVELVSAGHGPTMLFRASDRSVEQFGGDGLPLAIADNESYGPASKFAMNRGDVLIMLTDGVMEWQNPAGEQFGTRRMAESLVEASSGTAAEIIERMQQAVLRFAAGEMQADDVTIVAIKRR